MTIATPEEYVGSSSADHDLPHIEEIFYRRWAAEILTALPRPVVLMAPDSGHPLTRWPLDSYLSAMSLLEERVGGSGLVVTDAVTREQMRTMTDSLSYLTSPSPQLMSAVIRQADLVLANDSPVARAGKALGTPTITVFGPTMPTDTRRADSADLQGAPYCDLRDPDDPSSQPCLQTGRCLRGYSTSCTAGVHPSWLVDAALRLLNPGEITQPV